MCPIGRIQKTEVRKQKTEFQGVAYGEDFKIMRAN